jgi:hypothetical protein
VLLVQAGLLFAESKHTEEALLRYHLTREDAGATEGRQVDKEGQGVIGCVQLTA